ncbi:MAG TPA: metalloregulator ArsR/SmtB family transcription factor [Thermoanaerobaculia bacterium]|nr:metalloregulator ArsR/SmtB family transcription factor [Thermoanaerobaculia bacterium]
MNRKARSGNGKVETLQPEALELVAARFRILAEPLRLRILQQLHEGEKNVSELTAILQTTQPNVSKHLRLLQDAGFVGRRQTGNTVYCFIADSSVFDLCNLVCTGLEARLASHAELLRSPGRRGR